jgi:hypothetical protein
MPATTRRFAVMNLVLRGIEADFGPEHADINDVINKAVLKARKVGAPALPSGDGEPVDWNNR